MGDSAGSGDLEVDPGAMPSLFFKGLVHDFAGLWHTTSTLGAATGPEAEVPEIIDTVLDRSTDGRVADSVANADVHFYYSAPVRMDSVSSILNANENHCQLESKTRALDSARRLAAG